MSKNELKKEIERLDNDIDDLYNLLDSIFIRINDTTITDKEFRDYVYHVILEELGF